MSFEDELEKWIITYLVAHPNHSINTKLVIDETPRSLVTQIGSDKELFRFMMNMEVKGIIQSSLFVDFKLTTQGKLYFRKFIEPLFTITRDTDLCTQIIEQTEGTPNTRKRFKKLLNSIRDELPDDAEKIPIKYLTETSVEAIFYLVKLVVTAKNAN